MSIQEWSNLCTHFGIGEPTVCRPLGGTRNRNFILETGGTKWFVRVRHPDYCEPDRIRFDHAVSAFWASHNVPVPAPRRAPGGETFWVDGERVCEVYPYVPGRQLKDGDQADVVALAESLAVLHTSGQTFELRHEKAAPRGETDPQRLLQRLEGLGGDESAGDDALVPYRRAVQRAEVKLSARAYAELPCTLIHGDLQPANILVANGSIAAFVDLDWCMWLPRVYDLGFAILCCCTAHDTPFDGGDIVSVTQTPRFVPGLIHAFLERYERCGTPLTAPERSALHPQLMLTWCEMRIDGAYKVPLQERAAFLQRPPRDLETFLSDVLD